MSVESEATTEAPVRAPAAAAALRRCFLLEQCCSKFTSPQQVILQTCDDKPFTVQAHTLLGGLHCKVFLSDERLRSIPAP